MNNLGCEQSNFIGLVTFIPCTMIDCKTQMTLTLARIQVAPVIILSEFLY